MMFDSVYSTHLFLENLLHILLILNQFVVHIHHNAVEYEAAYTQSDDNWSNDFAINF